MPDETSFETAASQPVGDLCLSGGGYRAMRFSVGGAVCRSHEVGPPCR
jgi:hypothetical protein